jgi:hypothetical protein
LTGLVYASLTQNSELLDDVRALARCHDVADSECDRVVAFALSREPPDESMDPTTRAVLRLARALSPSPAQLSIEETQACEAAGISPPAIVEIAVWLSVLQMLQRLSSYYAVGSTPCPR